MNDQITDSGRHHLPHREGVPIVQGREEFAVENNQQSLASNFISDAGSQHPLQATEIDQKAEEEQGGEVDADGRLNTKSRGSVTSATAFVDSKVEALSTKNLHHELVQSDLTWDPECITEEMDDTFQQNIRNQQHPEVVAASNQDSFVRVPCSSTEASSVLSDFATASTSMDSDRTVIPVRPSFIHRRRHHRRNKTPTTSIMDQTVLEDVDESITADSNPRIGVKEMANVLRRSDARIQVNWEVLARVKYMHERFTQGSEFSFNYNVLLMVASLLAALGLVSNSSTTVIASMLVSPIMGPVVGIAYGATIGDWRLCRKAFKTELISIIVCIISGVLVAICTGWTSLGHTWPNDEMSARASGTNLLVGLPIAFVSGLGVAVGLLDDQTSSLVGVAISASLLPPAVNSGILWIAFWFHEEDWLGGDNKEVDILPLEPLPEPRDNEIYPERGGRILVDSDDHEGIELQTHKDFRQAGLISLALTIANIVLIIVSSMFMFRLKERLPVQKSEFWHDLGTARKIYHNLADISAQDSENMKDASTADVQVGAPKFVMQRVLSAANLFHTEAEDRGVMTAPVATPNKPTQPDVANLGNDDAA